MIRVTAWALPTGKISPHHWCLGPPLSGAEMKMHPFWIATLTPSEPLAATPSLLFPTTISPGFWWLALLLLSGKLVLCIGEGNGTPLQYSCLETPMDRGAWWAAVHGVAKSRTWLSDFTFTYHFHALEKEMATHCSVLAWRIPGTGEPGGRPSVGSHRVGHDWSDLAAAVLCMHLSTSPTEGAAHRTLQWCWCSSY